MQTITDTAQLLISEWIWALSWGHYQAFLSIIFLAVSLRFICQWSLLFSLLLALFSQASSFVLFGFFVYGMLFQFFGITYSPDQVIAHTPLQAGVQLAIIFTVLQVLLIQCFTRSYREPLYLVVSVVFISNMLGAFFAARFIPNMVL